MTITKSLPGAEFYTHSCAEIKKYTYYVGVEKGVSIRRDRGEVTASVRDNRRGGWGGDNFIAGITFCPWCGENLTKL